MIPISFEGSIQAAIWFINSMGGLLILIFLGMPIGFYLLRYLIENMARVLATIKFW